MAKHMPKPIIKIVVKEATDGGVVWAAANNPSFLEAPTASSLGEGIF
jgi:hypothetical protein